MNGQQNVKTQKLHFMETQLSEFEMTLEGTPRFRLIGSVLYSTGTKYVSV
jgi:hypothetical protein